MGPGNCAPFDAGLRARGSASSLGQAAGPTHSLDRVVELRIATHTEEER